MREVGGSNLEEASVVLYVMVHGDFAGRIAGSKMPQASNHWDRGTMFLIDSGVEYHDRSSEVVETKQLDLEMISMNRESSRRATLLNLFLVRLTGGRGNWLFFSCHQTSLGNQSPSLKHNS